MDLEEASTIQVHDTVYTIAQENKDGLTIKAGFYEVITVSKDFKEVTLKVGKSEVTADTGSFHIVDDTIRTEKHPKLKAAPKLKAKLKETSDE